MPHLRVEHILTREPDYDGRSEHLTADDIRDLLGDRTTSAAVFLCGPVRMTDDVRKQLRAAGIPRRRTHTEQFSF